MCDCLGDLDDLLAYKTDVRVKVRHRTIGSIYYVTMLAIAIGYIGFYEFYLKGGWGDMQLLHGTLRATVQANSRLAPLDRLQYCSQAVPMGTPPAIRYPCMSLDGMVTNAVQQGDFVIGTRVSTKYEERDPACPEVVTAATWGCERWVQTERVDQFVGDVENATVMIQHRAAPASVLAIGRDIVDTFHNRSYPVLYGNAGERQAIPCVAKHDPDPICPTFGDFFFVDDLLAVAGVDLDESIEEDGRLTTRRVEGLTMRVNLEYDGALSYRYRVSANRIESKTERAGWLNETRRVVYDVRGINILFVQTGGVRLLDWRTIILTLVSGLALLSVAKTVSDYFLLYVAPQRADYRLFVEQLTPDFGPDNDAERLVLAKVLARKRRERDEMLGVEEQLGTRVLLSNDGHLQGGGGGQIITPLPAVTPP